jgi:hypothetical protein
VAAEDSTSGLSGVGTLRLSASAPQIDFVDSDHNDWAIHVNGNRLHFIREPWNVIDLVLDGAGNVGIGTANPANILTILQSSTTDPIADSWTTYACDRTTKDIIRTLPSQSGALDQLVQVELYEWKRKPMVSNDEIMGGYGEELGAEEMERRRQELSTAKSILPKFQAKRLGLMLDDPNIPDEIIAIDGAGNKGLDLVGYIGWLHATIKELALRVQELEKR